MDPKDVETIRKLGLTEQTAKGEDAARTTVKLEVPEESAVDLDGIRAALEAQIPDLEETIAPHGGEVVPDSVVPLGQMLELRVPLEKLDAVEESLSKKGIRMDLQIPRRMNEP